MRISRRVWSPENTFNETVESKLTGSFGEPDEEGDLLKWSQKKLLGLHRQEIVFNTGECEVTVSTEANRFLYFLVVGLLLVFSALLLSSNFGLGGIRMIFLFLIYAGVSYWLFTSGRIECLEEFAILSEQEDNSLPFLLMGSGLLLMWYKFQILYPTGLVSRFMILIFIIFLGYSLSYNLVPFVSVRPGLRILATPVTALFWLMIPPILFVVFAFQPAYLYLRSNFHQSIFQNMTLTRYNASIITDMYGNIPSIEAIDLLVAQRSLEFFMIMILLIILVLVLMAVQARRQLSSFNSINVARFESSKVRSAAFAAFFTSNIAVLVTVIPAAAVLFYGVFEDFPFSGIDLLYTQAFTYQPLEFQIETVRFVNNTSVTEPVMIEESRQIQPEELVAASYEVLDTAFRNSGFLPPRVLSISFFGFLFAPQILLGNYWLYSLYSGIREKFGLLLKAEQLERDSEVVPEEIQVLVIEEEQASVLVNPMSLLFGWRNYIIINKSVEKKLTPDELDAVLAHEVYHINNQDLKVNAAAKIVSLGFGGFNALLTFYDYPRIEEEADDYARNKMGATATIVAIDKMDILAQRFSGKTIPGLSPGFVDSPEFIQSGWDSLSGIRAALDEYSSSPYKLLFGKVILHTAHLEPRERIARIRQNSQDE